MLVAAIVAGPTWGDSAETGEGSPGRGVALARDGDLKVRAEAEAGTLTWRELQREGR